MSLMSCLSLNQTHLQQALPLYKLSITEKVVQAVQSMLLPQEGSLSIHTSLPATGDGSSPVMAAVRLLAEIRTRSVKTYSNKLVCDSAVHLDNVLQDRTCIQAFCCFFFQGLLGDGTAPGG